MSMEDNRVIQRFEQLLHVFFGLLIISIRNVWLVESLSSSVSMPVMYHMNGQKNNLILGLKHIFWSLIVDFVLRWDLRQFSCTITLYDATFVTAVVTRTISMWYAMTLS